VPRNKQNNRKGEFALQTGEWASVLAQELCSIAYPHAEFDGDWKLLLLNQFHDILPGSSIGEVYADSDRQYKQILDSTSSITDNALLAIARNVATDGGTLVYNPNGFESVGTVTVDGECKLVKAPALGYGIVKTGTNATGIILGDKTIENGAYKLVFDKTGGIVSLFDKRYNREIVRAGERMNELRAYEDMPYQYDNWEMTPYHKQKEWVLDDEASFTPIVDGDRAGFIVTKKYFHSTITQKIFLYGEGLDRIDFVTDIEWKEKRQLLKARFPFDLFVDKATYDIQFGNIERSTSANTSWDAAKFETAAQKWVDFSEHNYGVALLNDSKYGFGAEDNTLTMTLLKSGSFPYDGASDYVPPFTYALYPHGGDYRDGKVIEAAYVLNRPFFSKEVGAQKGDLQERYSFASCDAEGVFIETVKAADEGDGIVLRMYEGYKETKDITLSFGKKIAKAYVCDMLEREEKELAISDNSVSFRIKPFEIVTLKIK
jgi:alpha-mannosidase